MPNALNGTTYIITYELGAGANPANLLAAIQTYGTWAKITENTWAIVSTSDKSSQVRDRLMPLVGVGGRIFVLKSGYESAWSNPHAKSEWLKKYLEN
jgi:hypothetical protein